MIKPVFFSPMVEEMYQMRLVFEGAPFSAVEKDVLKFYLFR